MSINTVSKYLLLSVFNQLCSYQKDRVSQMIRDFLETNQQMNEFHFGYCPKCGQLHPVLVKVGKTKAGKQMLKCNSCNKRFVCDHGQLTYCFYQSQAKWNDLIIETQNGNSLLKTAAKINVHESTVFRMRHKCLHFIEEMDETYVTHCRKGRIVEGYPGKKRGTPASKRGISDEKKCKNKVLNSYKEYDEVNHLNNVNSFHSKIQKQYRGVSSKYINRYNALFTL